MKNAIRLPSTIQRLLSLTCACLLLGTFYLVANAQRSSIIELPEHHFTSPRVFLGIEIGSRRQAPPSEYICGDAPAPWRQTCAAHASFLGHNGRIMYNICQGEIDGVNFKMMFTGADAATRASTYVNLLGSWVSRGGYLWLSDTGREPYSYVFMKTDSLEAMLHSRMIEVEQNNPRQTTVSFTATNTESPCWQAVP